jgi:WhiB family redox-sensing transcriptional regulator
VNDTGTPPWMLQAACSGETTDVFFTERGQRDKAAKQFCDVCPVRRPCLDYAMEHRLFEGVWGGLNADERRSLLRRRQKAARERRTA